MHSRKTNVRAAIFLDAVVAIPPPWQRSQTLPGSESQKRVSGQCSCPFQWFQQSLSFWCHSTRAGALIFLCPASLFNFSPSLCRPANLGSGKTAMGNTIPTIGFDICNPNLHSNAFSSEHLASLPQVHVLKSAQAYFENLLPRTRRKMRVLFGPTRVRPL